MSNAIELALFHFLKNTEYNVTPLNQIGTDADFEALWGTSETKLRTVPTPTGDIAYVRKFGTDYLIKSVTDITDPVDANMTFTIKATDGTTLGSRVGGGAFVAGSALATAQACYMEIAAAGGAVVVLAAITIDTDVDAGGRAFTCAAETVADAATLTLYLSDTGSTYYDILYRYGGARHTPVLDTIRKPYFDIATAYGAIQSLHGGLKDGVEILDSETYDEDLTTDNQALDSISSYLYSSSGQNPTITRGVGARVTREVSTQYNNLTAIYFNENGDNANAGTWQEPKLTPSNAITNRGTLDVVYGGEGATSSNHIFSEATTITISGFTLESDYGLLFTFQSTAVNINIICQGSGLMRGFMADGTSNGSNHNIYGNSGTASIYDCTIFGGSNCVYHDTVQGSYYLYRCKIYNAEDTGVISRRHNGVLSIIDCEIYSCPKGIGFEITFVMTLTVAFKNIIFRDNENAFYVDTQNLVTINGTLDHCVFINNPYAIRFIQTSSTLTLGLTITALIIINNSTYGFFSDVPKTITYCNFYNNGTDYNVNVTSNNEISGDPKLCKTTIPYKLGLSSDSPCYRSDSSGEDTGVLLRIIEIDASDIEINGIKIDGKEYYNNAIFIHDTADHIGLNIKWCNIFDCQGIGIDLYDDGTDLDAIVSNNIIKNNGNGGRLAYGGNTIEENIFFGNTIFSLWSDYTGNTFNHNVFYNNQYGIYLESNSGGIIIKNNIFNQNSLYDIYSEISLSITYCCITSLVNSNVDKTDDSNITDNPLFKNTTSGSEDFRLKSVESDDLLNSPCLDAGNDGDMGAYTENRLTVGVWWEKYQLDRNPTALNIGNIGKGMSESENAFGTMAIYGKSHRLTFPMVWDNPLEMTGAQRKQLQFFSGLVPTRENGYTKEETEFRIHIKPDTYLETGGLGEISATAKTLTEATKSLAA